MNILLVYPKYPETYWSFKHALKFVSKKAANIPLGILSVSALLPRNWNKRFTDLNVNHLKEKDILWADYVFISAMAVQGTSVRDVIRRCRELNAKIVAGGPLFTEEYEQFQDVDHLILNEAEITLPQFIRDLEEGRAKKIYQSDQFSDITRSPVPDYSVVKKLNKYATAGIQYSRGCPFDCEFCDITALFGRKVRTKTSEQIIAELDQLYAFGWKGSVFFVDDNFIGHKKKLRTDLLPAMIAWMEEHNNPFNFITEASIDLADDEDLMKLMVKAGFLKVFVGIETPEADCLLECNKSQNRNRDLMESVQRIQQYGMEVTAGFIVGFDSDPANIFERQIEFIQKSGIITAMVGLLNAPRLSKLYRRLHKEGRIVKDFSGDNTDYSINFIPKMDKDELMQGYRKIVKTIYSCKSYYERVLNFLRHYDPPLRQPMSFVRLLAFFKSVFYLGIATKHRKYYWNLILWSIFNRPRSFPLAVTYSIYGYHFQKVFGKVN